MAICCASTVLHNAQSVSVVRTPTQQAEDVIPFSRRHKSGATTILFSPDRTATARARLTRGNGGHHFAAAVGVAALKSGLRPIISVVAAEPANAARFIVDADEIVTAFSELQMPIHG